MRITTSQGTVILDDSFAETYPEVVRDIQLTPTCVLANGYPVVLGVLAFNGRRLKPNEFTKPTNNNPHDLRVVNWSVYTERA